MTTAVPDRPLRAPEVAERLGVSVRTLEDWRRTRTGPPWCQLSRTLVVYYEGPLEAWRLSKLRPELTASARAMLLELGSIE